MQPLILLVKYLVLMYTSRWYGGGAYQLNSSGTRGLVGYWWWSWSWSNGVILCSVTNYTGGGGGGQGNTSSGVGQGSGRWW